MKTTTSPLRGIGPAGLDELISSLRSAGYRVIGPLLSDGAIIYDSVTSISDLPRGILDEQAGGHYRTYCDGDAYFGYVVGPSTWKRYLHPPRQVLWRADLREVEASIHAEPDAEPPFAFLAVRPCELAAIEIQNHVFMEGSYCDTHYAARRQAALIIALNCGRATETCFCTSMGTGPKAEKGYDVALTEIATGKDAAFLAEAGSDKGHSLLYGYDDLKILHSRFASNCLADADGEQ